MSLPKKGTVGIINSNGLVEIVDVDNTLLDEYQAVDVPPHGRLVDADVLLNRPVPHFYDLNGNIHMGAIHYADELINAPTIIPSDTNEETEDNNLTCSDCKYVHEEGGRYFCYGQRFAPEVNPAAKCESWKPNYVTNHKYLQDLTTEEFAYFIFRDPAHLCMKTPNEIVDWLNKPVEREVFKSC